MSTEEAIPLRACGLSVDYPLPDGKPHPRWLFSIADVPRFRALEGFDLAIRTGELVGVLGHNGAGKSTLLRTLGGVLSPSQGSVDTIGIPGSLFELGGLGNVHLTGRQYAQRWFDFQGVPHETRTALVDDILEFSELGERFDDALRTYSSGMAARLYFAVATSVRHDLYLIDEILAVGDQHFQAKCWARMRDLLADRVSGVLVTHDWSAVLRLCERAVELKRGRVAQSGPSEQVVRRYLGLDEQTLPRRVRFASSLPETFVVTSGEPAVLQIPIESDLIEPVHFGFSIERLIPGLDWQVLLLGPPTLACQGRGRCTLELRIDSLPLWAGRYRLAVFLTTTGDAGAVSVVQDQRSWTSGNGVHLIVEGESGEGLSRPAFDCVVAEAP